MLISLTLILMLISLSPGGVRSLARVSAEEQEAASPAFQAAEEQASSASQASETTAIQRVHTYQSSKAAAIERARTYFRDVKWSTKGEISTEALAHDSEGVPIEWSVDIGKATACININTNIVRDSYQTLP